MRAMLRKLVTHPRGLAFWVILVVGLLTLAALALYATLLIQSLMQDFSHKHLVALLFNWQTQTGAAFAIAAALMGGAAVVHQTEDARRAEKEERRRRAMAEQAMLPFTLVGLAAYADDCAAIYDRLLMQHPTKNVIGGSLVLPALPLGVVPALGGVIAAVREEEAAPIAELATWVQIMHSRTGIDMAASAAQGRGILLRAYIPKRLADMAELYARCEQLVEYARSGTDSLASALTPNDVRQAVKLMRIASVAEVEAEITAREAGGNWPQQSFGRPPGV